MTVEQAVLDRHGLSAEEYGRIVSLLGREPNLTELGMFSVMWSEHCSYKSSRRHLRKLPTTGAAVLQGPGENAGAVDIGDGLAAVFKIESHNHPSFIEPYQGAATGVGGIIRDIFTMGARPVALLDSLRFGPLDRAANRRLLAGVVAGIGGYGNSIGIPTIGGEVGFDESYSGNPLVNAMCLGIARADRIVKGTAEGPGNLVYYVGARTGRDGIHGATMASSEFDERSAEKRPAVQVGDPFMEKLLLEACLEAMETDALVGVQDMGAAGLTCSTCEMGARAGTGVEIDLALVPRRETGMTPYELMLSESQERMLLVVREGRQAGVEAIFERWGLHAVPIGRVTGDGRLRVRDGGELVADVPARALTDEAPLYDRPVARPADLDAAQSLSGADLSAEPAPADALRAMLASPNVASKRWIYRQYDHMVRGNAMVLAGMGTPVIRIKGTGRALAMSVDGNGRYCALDPRRGAGLAVAEAARNVACAGARPLGATNCLNFGNPERPEIMWQFVEAVEGIADACRALGIPITGGNVSLYNETEGRAVLPTPVIGVVGVIDDRERVVGRVFPAAGLDVVLLGRPRGEIGGSEYLKVVHGLTRGTPPALDLRAELAIQRLLVEGIGAGFIHSAHDSADGGLAVAIAECCFDSGAGAEIDLPALRNVDVGSPELAVLFGESAPVVVVSTSSAERAGLLALAARHQVPAAVVGITGGDALRIAVVGEPAIDMPLAEAELIWSEGLGRFFATRAA